MSSGKRRHAETARKARPAGSCRPALRSRDRQLLCSAELLQALARGAQSRADLQGFTEIRDRAGLVAEPHLALGAIRIALQVQDYDDAIQLTDDLLAKAAQPQTLSDATKLHAAALNAYLQSDKNRGNYSWDSVKQAFEAEVKQMRAALRADRISMQNIQPFLKAMQAAIADKKVTTEEIERLTKSAHDATAKGKRPPVAGNR